MLSHLLHHTIVVPAVTVLTEQLGAYFYLIIRFDGVAVVSTVALLLVVRFERRALERERERVEAALQPRDERANAIFIVLATCIIRR